MVAFGRATVLTFDCYGTLIDWERGIVAAVTSVAARHAVTVADHDILARFAAIEPFSTWPWGRSAGISDSSQGRTSLPRCRRRSPAGHRSRIRWPP